MCKNLIASDFSPKRIPLYVLLEIFAGVQQIPVAAAEDAAEDGRSPSGLFHLYVFSVPPDWDLPPPARPQGQTQKRFSQFHAISSQAGSPF